jgi:hypothetical protein
LRYGLPGVKEFGQNVLVSAASGQYNNGGVWPQWTASDLRALRATFAAVLVVILGCAAYDAWNERGLYLDGVWVLYEVAVRDGFYLPAPARLAVDLIRQAPIVALTKYTEVSLLHRGQIYSLTIAALPALLVGACWFVAPCKRKSWTLFPLAFLSVGLSAVAFMPAIEASIANAYFWVLLFLLMFRTSSAISQALFLALCVPMFWLSEALFLLTPLLLPVCALRAASAAGSRDRIFLAVSAALIGAIAIYQTTWIIWPHRPTDLALVVSGLRSGQFLLYDGHVNLPFVTGVVAFAAMTAVFVTELVRPPWRASASRFIVICFAAFALAAVAAAFFVERSFSPYTNYHARYFPILVSLVLAATAIWVYGWPVPERTWTHPAILSIFIFLCVAQAAADIAYCWRWREYVTDLQSRLASSNGLIAWESTLHTGDARRDLNWRLLDHSWLLPVMSIVWAKDGVVKSMIDWPVGSTWKPLDPEKPDQLPKLPGIDYRPYVAAFALQRARDER